MTYVLALLIACAWVTTGLMMIRGIVEAKRDSTN